MHKYFGCDKYEIFLIHTSIQQSVSNKMRDKLARVFIQPPLVSAVIIVTTRFLAGFNRKIMTHQSGPFVLLSVLERFTFTPSQLKIIEKNRSLSSAIRCILSAPSQHRTTNLCVTKIIWYEGVSCFMLGFARPMLAFRLQDYDDFLECSVK